MKIKSWKSRAHLTIANDETVALGFWGTSIKGYVKLSEAGTGDSDSITGQFEVKIVQLRGGFMDRERR